MNGNIVNKWAQLLFCGEWMNSCFVCNKDIIAFIVVTCQFNRVFQENEEVG